MDKRKKRLFSFLILVIIIATGFFMNGKITTVFEWKLNWDISLPLPKKIEVVYTSRDGFPSEGATYTILDYNHNQIQKILEKDMWLSIDETSLDTVRILIQKFQKEGTNLNNNVEVNKQEVFINNPVQFTQDDQYSYKLIEDNSSLLVVLNKNNKKIYVMESIQ
ncbi:hypothetical protein M9R32_12520 [Paenisporosarcina quisquiliarum]|uniref:Uncharacterized protein n=1 Tax=Paenisporosarcina quisquiliarum TaxID=365346 RepID=A0A9X3LHC6_9BACL|nr:hypothetical protein [Paenisporosarcina quisquiliarum]MCZ8538012.1 hypothetical protein [Paenisporosarcina quisquiliarum]